ncbi:hypothetical protein PC113_g19264 [Phytophthora cactorum]|uniref:Uncharacterized protein n=1 Tax=Phytophthora cactorum TaxID=29920 RepID=A0A8T0YDS3_9STRA|nr:hypothetical protein PC113_g19264 [Phytophthora cactorum]
MAAVEVPLVDFADIHADDDGFILLGTRDAEGGGTLNCGDPSNLCSAPSDAVPCYDMYLVCHDGSTETWATKLTSASASLPTLPLLPETKKKSSKSAVVRLLIFVQPAIIFST